MNQPLFTLLVLLLISLSAKAQYYAFPSCGWTQAMELGDAPPANWDPRFNLKTLDGDTLINGHIYSIIVESYFPGKKTFIRQESGRVIRYKEGADQLLFDFSAGVGDTVEVFSNYLGTQDLIVSGRSRYLTGFGDSLIAITLLTTGSFPSMVTWLEGVGDQRYGLYNDYFGIESGEISSGTRDHNGVIYINDYPFLTYTFEFLHGEDNDNDGAYNQNGGVRTIYLTCESREIVRIHLCDTLKIIYNCPMLPVYVSHGFGEEDQIENLVIQGDTILIADLSPYQRVLIHHQFDFDNFLFADIWLHPCHQEDCDDADPTRYPCATEVVNNGVDEDCDGQDLITTARSDVSDDPLFSVYPNPAKHRVNVVGGSTIPLEIQLYDLLGNALHTQKTGNTVDVSSLTSGIYLLEIADMQTRDKEIIKLFVWN